MNHVDRSGWPSGPWDSEPNELVFEHLGVQCVILRHAKLGHFCGYAEIARHHRWFGFSYESVEDFVVVHGGLTYSGALLHWQAVNSLYAGSRWFGFDCDHSGDLAPAEAAHLISEGERPHSWRDQYTISYKSYRNINYVKDQTKLLALQIALARKVETAVLAKIIEMHGEVSDLTIVEYLTHIYEGTILDKVL